MKLADRDSYCTKNTRTALKNSLVSPKNSRWRVTGEASSKKLDCRASSFDVSELLVNWEVMAGLVSRDLGMPSWMRLFGGRPSYGPG